MRHAARAIIQKDDSLLLMHRNKFGQEYFILVGGGIEIGETPEQAVLREIQEEVGVQVSQPRLVFVEQAPEPYGAQYVFLCNYLGGEAKLDLNSVEQKINEMGKNLYTPEWHTFAEVQFLKFRSDALKHAILKGLSEGFPSQPIDITGG